MQSNKTLFFLGFFGILLFAVFYFFPKNAIFVPTQSEKIQNGDIIFQISQSGQGKAIQLATKSEYTHCGIIYENKGNYWVYEAVQPVKLTPLQDWIKRGKKQHYVIKRLKNAEQVLTKAVLQEMKTYGEQFLGKNYDLYFDWSDDRIYCSELVWKIYKMGTGLEIGKREKLKDFDLSSAEVRKKMAERYGNRIPYEEWVISPAGIFESEYLITIKSE